MYAHCVGNHDEKKAHYLWLVSSYDGNEMVQSLPVWIEVSPELNLERSLVRKRKCSCMNDRDIFMGEISSTLMLLSVKAQRWHCLYFHLLPVSAFNRFLLFYSRDLAYYCVVKKFENDHFTLLYNSMNTFSFCIRSL